MRYQNKAMLTMNKPLSLFILTSVTLLSLTFTGCSDDKKDLHRKNTFLMIGTHFLGPVKSVNITIDSPSDSVERTTGEINIEFYPSGELSSYYKSANVAISIEKPEESYKYHDEVFINKDAPYKLNNVRTYIDESNELGDFKTNKEIVFERNTQGQITNIITTDYNRTSSAFTVDWKNGFPDMMMADESSAPRKTKFNYNKQGLLISSIERIESNDKHALDRQIPIVSKKYFYDNNSLSKEVSIYDYPTSDSTDSDDGVIASFECKKKDTQGNCLVNILSIKDSSSKEATIRRIYTYRYQYY